MKRFSAKSALFITASMNLVLAGQAYAQSADDTIIVTARRVEERLQDVPISLTVVDQNRLSQVNVANSEDLVKVVPGLSVQSRYSSEMATFSIRGFAQELRTSATVGTYFADVVSPRGGGATLTGGDGAGAAYLFDLQNVQVLKGPQGTLFGRNTTGGAVLLVPRKPTSRLEGYVEGSIGNYDMKRIQGVLNIPISDSARLRIGVDRMTRDGYLNNVSGIGPKQFGNIDYTAVRASFVADLAPNLESYTIGTFLQSDHVPASGQVYNANPSSAFGVGIQPQIDRLNASDDFYAIEQKLANPRSWTQQWQIINTMTWRASDDLTIRNIASYSELRQILQQDVFATNVADPATGPRTGYVSTSIAFTIPGGYVNDQYNITEELQLQGLAGDGKLNWQAGVYYEDSLPGSFIGTFGPSASTRCRLGAFTQPSDLRCRAPGLATGAGSVNNNMGKIRYINMGAYAQGTYALTDQLKLTAGVRYTYDRTNGTSISRTFTFNGALDADGYRAIGTTSCARGYSAANDCRLQSKTSTKKPTWTLNLAYNPVEDVMLYATYSRGYRQGAAAPFAAPEAQTFGPETVDVYEVGAKTSFRGKVSGRFNVAGFYSNLFNPQIQYGLQNASGGSGGTSIFSDGGKARIYGAELESSLQFLDFFRLDASGTYLNTKLLKGPNAGPFPAYPTVIPSTIVGDPLSFSPEWAANVSGTIMIPTPESVGKLEVGATYRYQASFQTAASTVSRGQLASSIKQVDLNLDWRDVGGRPVDFSLFATNVTKQKVATLITPLYATFGFDTRYLGEPRIYGAKLRVRFGAGN